MLESEQSPRASPRGAMRVLLPVTLAALVGAYVAWTLSAPGAAPLAPPPWGASLPERLFPGVPPAWVALRLGLIACVIGIVLVWVRGPNLPLADVAAGEAVAWPTPGERRYRVALGVALLHLAMVPFAGVFPRGLQLLYVGLLAVPAFVLSRDRRARSATPASRRTPWAAIGVVAAAWAAWRVPGLQHSPLVATGTDSNIPYWLLRQTLEPGYNLINDQLNPGFTAILSVLQGAALLGLGPDDLTLAFMQAAQVAWTLVAAALLGYLAAQLIHRCAAPVAVAVYLFSPYTTATLYLMGPLFLGGIVPAVLLALWLSVVRDGRPWALAAMGSAAGLSATHPAFLPIAAASVLSLLPWLWRRPATLPVALLAALSGANAVLPGLPNPSTFLSMSSTYTRAQQLWTGMEAGAFGLVPPALVEFQRIAGQTSPFDSVIGVVVSPWATPRTAMRLWGDAFIEPLGAGLFAVGLGIVIVGLRRSAAARQLLALLALAMLPAVLSSYDRPSLTRAVTAPLLMSLVAAVGYGWFAQFAPTRSLRQVVAAAVTVLVAASGIYLFDSVQPRILARSSVSIALEAVDATHPCPPAMILVDPQTDPQQTRLFAEQLPRCPIAVVAAESAASDFAASAGWLERFASGTLTLWSPGLEDSHEIAEALCAREPATSLWVLFDAAGLSTVFAASAPGSEWQPTDALPPAEARRCGQTLPTERNRARKLLAEAGLLLAADDPGTAIERLRQGSQTTFVQAPLYRELARLLRESGDPGSLDEAVYWSWRASVVERHRHAASVRLLAETLRDAGRPDEARETLRRTLADVGDRFEAETRHGLEQLLRELGDEE